MSNQTTPYSSKLESPPPYERLIYDVVNFVKDLQLLSIGTSNNHCCALIFENVVLKDCSRGRSCKYEQSRCFLCWVFSCSDLSQWAQIHVGLPDIDFFLFFFFRSDSISSTITMAYLKPEFSLHEVGDIINFAKVLLLLSTRSSNDHCCALIFQNIVNEWSLVWEALENMSKGLPVFWGRCQMQ